MIKTALKSLAACALALSGMSASALAADTFLMQVEPLTRAEAKSLLDAPYQLDARNCPVEPVFGESGNVLHFNNAAPELMRLAWFGDQNGESREELVEVDPAEGVGLASMIEEAPVDPGPTFKVVTVDVGGTAVLTARATEVGGLIFTFDAQMKNCLPNEEVLYVRVN